MARRPLAIALMAIAVMAPARGVQAAASSCDIKNVPRIVAVADAHGAYERYVEILTAAGVIGPNQRWSGGRTHFVQLGDMVDRGAGSRKILDLVRRLEREAPRSGGAVHVLLGNHEVMRMLGDLRYVTPGEYEAFTTRDSEDLRARYLATIRAEERDAAARELPPGSIELQQAFGPRGDYGKWLRGLDVVARINGVLFLHGGISPAVAPMTCEQINDTVHRELAGERPDARGLATREDGPLWYRGLAQEPDDFASSVDAILASQKASAIVVGHTVSPTGRIRVRFGGKVLQLDTGMQPAYVTNGHASALVIEDGHATAIYDDRAEAIDVPALR